MSLIALLTSYRMVGIQRQLVSKLHMEVELNAVVSVEALSQIAEWVRPHSSAERTTIFYSLRADAKPRTAWVTSQFRKGQLPHSEMMGVTLFRARPDEGPDPSQTPRWGLDQRIKRASSPGLTE